ncbi:NIPSNAP family protein [Pseudonocardia spinosispora]|uniref:NIPSNAP family protein n=1 Tax=Pseudonocardia spinosispora TaxID=103441 RepID=UPI00041AD60A|nr:NIPSNAP family protein [Pseudonocardia spinosispora]
MATVPAGTLSPPRPASGLSSPVLELRQYTFLPGARDTFIELFDREFIGPQEAAGARIVGQFRDLGDPNRFIWLRGFPDMITRKKALETFYNEAPAWITHGDTVRSLLIDHTDVLLLKPVRPDTGFALDDAAQRPAIESDTPNDVVIVTIHHLDKTHTATFMDFYETVAVPAVQKAGAHFLGMFETNHSPNDFPVLPVRENQNVFITFTGFADLNKYHDFLTALGKPWKEDVYPRLTSQLIRPPQTLRLTPTTRSQLRSH